MTHKLVVIISSLKVPKIKKILLYEMKFLLPNYSCLQNPWLGGYRTHIPVLSVLCPQLNLLNPPPNKIPGYATSNKERNVESHCIRRQLPNNSLPWDPNPMPTLYLWVFLVLYSWNDCMLQKTLCMLQQAQWRHAGVNAFCSWRHPRRKPTTPLCWHTKISSTRAT